MNKLIKAQSGYNKKTFELDEKDTASLMGEANRAYRTKITDILLSALTLTIANWTKEENISISLEATGREKINEDIDISRTIGCFSSQYPIVLTAYKDIDTTIKSTKDRLRIIPDNGLVYGLLEYPMDESWGTALKPEISFRYLGEVDHERKNYIFKLSDLECEENYSKSNLELYSLEILGVIVKGRLMVSILYSQEDFYDGTIDCLVENYNENLLAVIKHCIGIESPQITISDITEELITLEELTIYQDDLHNIKKIYPLAPMQKGMLYHALMEEKDVYNIVTSLQVEGYIDQTALEAAFNRVLERHDILRTIFDYSSFKDNMQVVYKNRKTTIDYVDLSDICCDKEEYINTLMEEYRRIGFRLNKDILIKFILVKMAENQYTMILNTHHILIDGWGIGLIIGELFKIYNEIKHGIKAKLHEVVPYFNYIKWIQYKDGKAAREYWRDYLNDYDQITRIPFEMEQSDSVKKNMMLILDEKKTKSIHRIAMENKVTINTIMQSIWAIFLKKYNNTDDVVFGYVVSGRNTEIKGIESILGLFINTIPLRVKFDEDTKYQELIKNIGNITLKNNRYDYLSLAEIQNVCGLKNELINSLFVFENYPFDENELMEEILVKNNLKLLGGNTTVIDNSAVDATNYNFTVTITQSDKLTIDFNYNEKAYSRKSVLKIKTCFESIIDQIIKNETITIEEIDITTKEEKYKILHQFNDTKTCYPKNKTIAELFEEQVEEKPDAIAVVYQKNHLTYKEVNQKANSLAWLLRKKGVGKNAIVGVMIDHSLEMIIGIIAILKAGGAYLPIDLEYPDDRIRYMVENCETSLILTDSDKEYAFLENVQILNIKAFKLYDKNVENLNLVNDAKSLAYVIYTSGTTGTPKGVGVIQKGVVRLVKNTNYIEIKKEDRLLQTGSIAFDASTFEFWITLLNGASLHIADKDTILDQKNLEAYLITNKITVLFMTPALFNQICGLDPNTFRELRYLLLGGEVVSPKYVNAALEKASDVTIINAYGPTENTVFSTWFQMKELQDEAKAIPIGIPISNSTAYILDKNKHIVPIGVSGELYLSGEGLAVGYINNEELTKEKFLDNPFVPGEKVYRSGDLARWLPDGNIEFLGRMDQQIKIRGFRIELGEIENNLLKIDGVKEAVVNYIEAQEDKYLCAYYVSEKEYSVFDFKELLKKYIPGFMIPSYFIKVIEMPLTKNGKINRKKLPIPDRNIDIGVEYVEPVSEIEKAVASVWEKVLGVNKVGINEEFFALGGDSIKAIQAISQMSSQGYFFKMKDLISNPTIRELVIHRKQKDMLIDQGEVHGEIELTPIQNWFFKQDKLIKEYFNQEMLFMNENGFNEGLLEKTFIQIIEHHDILRAVYVDHKLINRGINSKLYEMYTYDLRGEDSSDHRITDLCTQIQRSMNLKNGPLVRLGLIKTDIRDYFLVAIHHLVVDMVSWRIIVEDMDNIYSALKRGEEVKLPQKTTSFQEWSARQKEYASSYQVENEFEFWNQLSHLEVKKLTIGGVKCLNGYTQQKRTVTLNQEYTNKLILKTNRAYSTEVNEIMLSALVLTIGNFNDTDRILLNLESHGREQIINDVDITRTVGWFTSQYPVILNKSENISELIRNTKDTLRKIPNKGIGFGILKYLSSHKLEDINQPEISFNYLGQFDGDITRENFILAVTSAGDSISRESERLYPLDIVGMVINREFNLSLSYNAEEFQEECIEQLLTSYMENLRRIIDHCVFKERVEITVSDITSEDITFEELAPYMSCLENIKSIYALSPMQEGLLYESEYKTGDEAYHVSIELTIIGNLDIEMFNKSFQELIARHDAFRTNFNSNNFGANMQIVYRSKEALLEYLDIRDYKDDKIEYVRSLIYKDREKGFDLSKDLLLRLFVIRHTENKYSLILSNHHIILDGWSLGIIGSELFRIYSSFMLNAHANIKKETPYREYIRWLKSQDQRKALNYWSEYLKNYSNSIEIPFKKISTTEGRSKDMDLYLDQNRTNRIEALAKYYNVTVNTVLQSIWAIQLQRYNNVDDVVFGFIVSGRNIQISGIDEMVGLFINTIPLRVNVSLEKNYSKIMRKIKSDFEENQSYHYYPIAEIQKLTEIRQGLITTLMVFENYPIDKNTINQDILEKINIEIEGSRSYEQTNYYFNIKVIPGEEMLIVFDYNDGHYSEEAVRRIRSHFSNILNQVIENPEIEIDEIELLDEVEKREIFHEFNGIYTEYERQDTIHDLFESQVMKHPFKTAIVFDGKEMSYDELNRKANSFALILREKEIGPESVVPIMIGRSFEMVIGIFAILKAGAAYLPIDIEYPEDRVNYMLEDSRAEVLITTKEIAAHRTLKINEVIEVESEALYWQIGKSIENRNKSNDLAYVIYTSGTTGRPKGVMLEHKGVVNLCQWFIDNLGIGDNENILQFASIAFDAFSWEMYMTLLLGNTFYIPDKDEVISPDLLNEYIKNNNITTITLPPFVAANLDPDNGLRRVVAAGSELKYEQISHLIGNMEVINAYGPTEDTVCTTYYRVTKANSTGIPIGKPIKNHSVVILDNNNKLIPVGVKGELCIAGVGLARGYLHNEALTKEKFVINPYMEEEKLYKTGDIARWLPSGDIEYIGRADHQVKIRGYRIEMGEIEQSMLKVPGISQTVIIDREKDGMKYICAYFVSEKDWDTSELRELLMRELPKYMVPAYFIKLDALPFNSNGKVDRKRLPEIESQVKTMVPYEEPENEIERAMVDICKKILGIEQLGIRDNLFEVGADSIRIVKIHKEFKKANIDISIKDMFYFEDLRSIYNNCLKEKREIKCLDMGEIEKSLVDQLGIFSDTILQQNKVRTYPISAIQEITRETNKTYSGAIMNFNHRVNVKQLKRSIERVINSQSILRSILVWSNHQVKIEEYDKADRIVIPYVNLEKASEEQKEDTIAYITNVLFQENKENRDEIFNHLLYKVILVKLAGTKYKLYMPFNHMIFDGMSMEIVKANILRAYSNRGELEEDEILGYHVYVNQLVTGPQEVSEEEIMQKFNLEVFEKSLDRYLDKFKKNSFQNTMISIQITEEIQNAIKKMLWEVSLKIFIMILEFDFGTDNIPFAVMHSGRKYGINNYYNTIGEFIDILPFSTESIQNLKPEKINHLIGFAYEKNINFATLICNKELRNKYKKISNALSGIYTGQINIPVFNFLGLYDSEEEIRELGGDKELYATKHLSTEIIMTLKGDQLVINLFCEPYKTADIREKLEIYLNELRLEEHNESD